MEKLLVILGPTATGKTDLGLNLAKKFNGELVACDSRQVYKGLDIGTGKMPTSFVILSEAKNLYPSAMPQDDIKKNNGWWEVNGIRIWMYDVMDPKVQYTVADYVKDASKVIDGILKRGKLPIIVGGTGFYLKALLEGFDSLEIGVDKKLRKSLEKLSLGELQKKLQEVGLDRWNMMNKSDKNNPRRLVRAIELQVSPRRSYFDFTQYHLRGVDRFSGYDILQIGLTAPRKVLYKRVDERVVSRMKQGMLKEAENLNKNGLTLKRMRELGLEYGVLADYLDNEIKTIEELIKIMQGQIHGYVRKQLTWFKSPSTSSGFINWFDITDKKFLKVVEKLASNWYHSIDD